MMRSSARLAALAGASAAAAVALSAPATAAPPPITHQHEVLPSGHFTSGSRSFSGSVATGSGTDWAQVGYGTAGGIALAAAGAAGIVLVRRHQHVPHHA